MQQLLVNRMRPNLSMNVYILDMTYLRIRYTFVNDMCAKLQVIFLIFLLLVTLRQIMYYMIVSNKVLLYLRLKQRQTD